MQKAFEEFYVEGEFVDFERFSSLGVIKDKSIPSRDAVVDLIHTLDDAFETEDSCK